MTILGTKRGKNLIWSLYHYLCFFHLIECDDADFEACVLPDDFLSVCVCVEWVHENEGDISIEGLVKVLDLLNRQVQEAEVRTHLEMVARRYGHQITSI